MNRRPLILSVLATLAVVAAPAHAGNFYTSFSVQHSESIGDSDVFGDGIGVEVSGGYFFDPRVAVELSGLFSDFDSSFNGGWLGSFTGGLRLSPFPYERIQPYVKGGFGGYFLEDDYSYGGLAGYGFNAGGGIELFMVPGISIGAEASWRWVEYTDEYYDDCCGTVYYPLGPNLDSTMFSIGGTLTYHFH